MCETLKRPCVRPLSYDKMKQTKGIRHSRHLFPVVLETGKPKVEALADPASSQACPCRKTLQSEG